MNNKGNRIITKCFRENNAVVALGLVVVLLFFSQYFSENYQRTLELQRKLTYGFHNGCVYNVSQGTANRFISHRAITNSGMMRINGQILDSNGNQLGAVGQVDADFKHLQCLTFLEGGYPISNNEIAVESILLDQLNLPYKIGENISLQIVIDDSTTINRIYRLTGILKTYTTNWKNEGFPLCTAFVGGSEDPILQQHLFFYADYDNAEQMDELQQLISNTSSYLIYNAYSYPNTHWSIKEIVANGIVTAISTIISVLLLVAIHIGNYNKQIHRMRVLISLGIDSGRLYKLIYWQICRDWLAVFSTVSIGCTIVCLLLHYFVKSSLQNVLSIFPYVLSGSVSLFICLLAITIQIIFFYNIPILPKREYPSKLRPALFFNKHCNEIADLNDFCILERKRICSHYFSEISLSFLSIVVLFICSYGICISYKDYKDQTIIGCDYAWTSFDSNHGLLAKDILKIRNVSNIDSVVYSSHTSYCDNSQIYMEYSGCYSDPYRIMHNSRQDYNDDSGLCVKLIAIPEESPLWDYYVTTFSQSPEAFLRGERVIVFLPELQEVRNSFYSAVNTFDVNTAIKSSPTFRPDLNPGEIITITTSNKKTDLVCDNIIYSFPSGIQTNMDFLSPGSILVSESLYCNLLSIDEIRYNDVFAIGNYALSYEISDKLMSNISSVDAITFTNNRIQNEVLRQECILDVTMLTIVAILSCTLTILILYRKKICFFSIERERIAILSRIGCSQEVINRIFFPSFGVLQLTFLLLLNATIVLLLAYREYIVFISIGAFWEQWNMICRYAFTGFPWLILIMPQLCFWLFLVATNKSLLLKITSDK